MIDFSFKPPIKAIRVKSCGNDWVTDCDATLTTDQIRGFSLDSDGVHIYSKERDIHGAYDNIFVPYSNLEALVFYFNEPLNVIEPYMQHDEDDGFDELIKPSDIDYMHTPSVEEIIKGDGE